MTRQILVLLALVPMSWTWGAAAGDPVPIEQEPRHRLRFENQHVRFFDVALEPGYVSLYHWHRNDGVFVNIAASATIAQEFGKDPVPRSARAIGETYFIGYGGYPKAHRVSNTGSTVYHVTDTEILAGCAASDAPVPDPGQALLLDNARVLVTRIMLHPGESADLHAPCGMLVSVSGGRITLFSPGGSEHLDLAPAGFQWRKHNETTKIVNSGNFVFHAVDIRLK